MEALFDFDLTAELHSGSRRFRFQAACRSRAARLAVVGASGSGKTLLLQLLAGLRRPQSGHIRLNGLCCYDGTKGFFLPPQQRQTGMVFQDYALFPHLTVSQNIAFGLHRRSLNPPRRPCAEVSRWLDKMHLSALAEHYPHQLSGGQQQRVALARACITRPRYLLLDEPFSALDADLRQEMRQTVAQLQQELQQPLLLVSHDMEDTAMLADEVWVMRSGRLLPPQAA